MSDLVCELRDWAARRGVPEVLRARRLSPRTVSILLVGSVATGHCRRDSDVDLVILCRRRVFSRVSQGTPWAAGRPTEVWIEGRQLHYFAQPVEEAQARLRDLDDHAHYMYGTALALLDRPSLYAGRLVPLATSPSLRKARLDAKLDLFLRRLGALRAHYRQAEPIVAAQMSLEVLTLAMKTAALLDGSPFDPRKRLMETALSGPLGRTLGRTVRSALGCASGWQPGQANRRFLAALCRLEEQLRAAALKTVLARKGKQ